MNISETKEKLLELYLKSLKIRTKDYYSHPVRLVQAVKSITGINIENPIEHLLVFCENYIDEFEAEDDMQPSDNIEMPLMVSYKKLEEALLSKDKKKSSKVLSELKRVSEGSQILKVYGNTRSLLAGERTALNFLGFMSGISKKTNHFVRIAKPFNSKIFSTRKTIASCVNLRLLF